MNVLVLLLNFYDSESSVRVAVRMGLGAARVKSVQQECSDICASRNLKNKRPRVAVVRVVIYSW